jgi:hypothetical protein
MNKVDQLALARIAIGAGFWAAPERSLALGGLDATAPQSPYLGRMFGAREIAFGLVTLLAPAQQKRNMILLGLAVDALDAGAGVLATRSAGVSPARGALLAGAGAAAVVTGVVGLKQLAAATPRP